MRYHELIDLVIWAGLFIFAIVLAFPPKKLRRVRIYSGLLVTFLGAEFYLQWRVFQMLASDIDHGAGDFLASPLMLFPLLLYLFLLLFRGVLFLATCIYSLIEKRV